MYVVTVDMIYNEYIGWYTTYGICDKGKTVIVPDVTTDYNKAMDIVKVLNSQKVSKIHLRDVIIDMLE